MSRFKAPLHFHEPVGVNEGRKGRKHTWHNREGLDLCCSFSVDYIETDKEIATSDIIGLQIHSADDLEVMRHNPCLASIAWQPGVVPAGRVDGNPWAFWDLMPTFLELSGGDAPVGYQTDGKSLVDFLKGGRPPQREYFYWELHESDRPEQAARFGDWKAVRNGFDEPMEIYDLSNDPDESDNLAQHRPDLVKRAATIFREAHTPNPEWPLDHPNDKTYSQRPSGMENQKLP